MADMTDMRHYLDVLDPFLSQSIPAPALRLARFFGSIVEGVTAGWDDPAEGCALPAGCIARAAGAWPRSWSRQSLSANPLSYAERHKNKTFVVEYLWIGDEDGIFSMLQNVRKPVNSPPFIMRAVDLLGGINDVKSRRVDCVF